MPLQQTSGAASYDAFGGGAPVAAKYIEDFFSAWLRTGTGSSQTVTTGIKENTGALVISKSRSAATDWAWYDTFRGATKDLASNTTAAETTQSQGLTSFNTDGHTWGTLAKVNTSGNTYVDFVLKPTPKFFDIVTWSGDSTSGRQISHNLGATPGMVIVKSLATDQWTTWHRSLTSGNYIVLNSTAAQTTAGAVNRFGNGTTTVNPTDTVFTVGSNGEVNQTGNNYVAYLFAHNAGGFGLTGTDNVISCGSFTTDGSGVATVDLGYEPQYLMWKASSQDGNWLVLDNMRGWTNGGNDSLLRPNTSDAESTGGQYGHPTATGFYMQNMAASATYIYIAIRRGPMKVPTSGTTVFYPEAVAQADNPASSNVPFPPDLVNTFSRNGTDRVSQYNQFQFVDRLRGLGTPSNTLSTDGLSLLSASTAAEASATSYVQLKADSQNITRGNGWGFATYGNWIYYFFRRAPSFFDEVCYTGTGSARTITHNLAAVPELMIVKCRSTARAWPVYAAPLGNTEEPRLNESSASGSSTSWNSTTPTSSVFSVSNGSIVNASGDTYVAYLFATCAGVSKCGTFTGNGSSQTINCGFTGGARFVMIKATSTTGNWIVADSARGIVAGNDPALYLNSTAAEVTGLDWIDADNSGFVVNETATIAANTNGVSYIFFAVA